MTVVERKERVGSRDRFPVGMRVLAVDDDPTCLKVLESLLVRCQYHVKTTNQAIKALEMLRENKDQFDLVISDVHMPDMDGFKLLELVGLEMDLPVIMLSANGETQTVMKGITHGACDYLLKPVRIEELKNIWQHVIRRKKFDAREQNNLDSVEDCNKNQLTNSEGTQDLNANGSSDRYGKLSRKRKDQNEDEDDDSEDNLHDNEDQSSQKKPRVVWSVELHRKFVAAVNQLGIDKAVPKRILDLMNVERLTRENVASHLQKYRLYLKRLSAVANQQANMVAALRGRDTTYLPMGSLDGYTNFNSLIGPRTLPGPASFQTNSTLSRMNSFTGFGLHGFAPSTNAQLGHAVNDAASLPGMGLHTLQNNQQGVLISGMQLQQPKAVQEASSLLLGGFSGSGVASTTKTPTHLLQVNQQQVQSVGLSSQPVRAPPVNSDPFDIGILETSRPVDMSRCNENWQGAIQSTAYPANTLPMSLPYGQNDLSSCNIGNSTSPMASQMGGNTQNASSSCVVMAPVRNSLPDAKYQTGSLQSTTGLSSDVNSLNFRNGNSDLKWDHAQTSNIMCNSSSDSSMSNIHITEQNNGYQRPSSGFTNKKVDVLNVSPTSFGAPLLAHDPKFDRVAAGGQSHYKDESLFEDMKLPAGVFNSGGFGLDDLVTNTMIKPECDDFSFIDGDMGCNDLYSLGACM